jgi:hypothetical protein
MRTKQMNNIVVVIGTLLGASPVAAQMSDYQACIAPIKREMEMRNPFDRLAYGLAPPEQKMAKLTVLRERIQMCKELYCTTRDCREGR